MRYITFLTILFVAIVATSAYQDNIECSLCSLAVSITEQYLDSNKTEQYIESELDSFCSHFTFNNKCQELVSEYIPYVIELLEQKETPEQICSQIGLCSSIIEIYPISNDSICVYVVSLAEALLETGMIETSIEKELDKACLILPESLTTECDSIIDNYFPELIKLLEEKYPPSVICSYI